MVFCGTVLFVGCFEFQILTPLGDPGVAILVSLFSAVSGDITAGESGKPATRLPGVHHGLFPRRDISQRRVYPYAIVSYRTARNPSLEDHQSVAW